MKIISIFLVLFITLCSALAQTSPGARYTNVAAMVISGTSSGNRSAWTQGGTVANDGLSGFYVYDSAYTGPTNLFTLVDASPGAGAWYATLMSPALEAVAVPNTSLVNADYYHSWIEVTDAAGLSNAIIAAVSNPDRRVLIFQRAGIYNGYYDLTRENSAWVDIVGECRDCVTNSFTGDVPTTGGIFFMSAHNMLANMTIEVTPATTSFPIHIDNNTDSTNAIVGVCIVNNVTARNLGANANAGIGLEVKAGQTVVLANSSFYSAAQEAINAHNAEVATSYPGYLYLLNVTASTDAPLAAEQVGLNWRNTGSTQPDTVVIRGGKFTGTTAGILYTNNGSADVSYMDINGGVLASSIAFSTASKRLNGVLGIPAFRNKLATNEFSGIFRPGPTGAFIFDNGKYVVQTNVSFWGPVILSPSATQIVAAGDTVSPNASTITTTGSGGNVTMTSTPTISAGTSGQILIIRGSSDSLMVTFQDEGTLSGSGLELGNITRQIGLYDTLTLRFDPTSSKWVELAYVSETLRYIQGSGTATFLARFTGAASGTVVGDSIISTSGQVVTINGGASSITTTTGNFSLLTGGGNGDIILDPNGAGEIEIPANVVLTVAGNGLKIKEGSNARMGQATLINGTVTVANTSVTANTRIFVTRTAINGSLALGVIEAGTITAATSFVINSYTAAVAIVATDQSIINWLLVEPSP